MNGTGQRAARVALDAARSAVAQLNPAAGADDTAATVIEAWEAVEQALRALAGTSALSGQPLLRELRQRELLNLAEAHALIDFGALAERARAPNYAPTPHDLEAARMAVEELGQVVERGGTPPSRPAAAPPPSTPGAAPGGPPVPAPAG